MSIFGKIAGALFEEDPKPVENTEVKKPVEAQSAPVSTVNPTITNIAVVNQKIYTLLKETIEPVGKETMDKFNVTLNSLATAIIDIKTRYTTALSISAGYGINKENLIGIYDEKIKTLENEKNGFSNEQQSKLVEIEKKVKETENIAIEIENLQKKIGELSESRFKLLSEIEQEKFNVNSMQNQFDVTFTNVYNELVAEKSRIEM